MCTKFGLLHQVESCVHNWIYQSITNNMLYLTVEPEKMAFAIRTTVEGLFHANKQSRVIILHHEFHSMVVGTLFINDYYKHMEVFTGSLCDVSTPSPSLNLCATSCAGSTLGILQLGTP